MNRKIYALMLAFVMLLAAFSGCAKDDKGTYVISASKLIRNREIWDAAGLLGLEGHQQVIEYEEQADLIHEYGLGIASSDIGGDFIHSACGATTGEGVYLMISFGTNGFDSAGYHIDTPFFDGIDQGSRTGIENREQIVNRILRYFKDACAKEKDPDRRSTMDIVYLSPHYAARAGIKNLGVELQGNNLSASNAYAMLRGAAREYGTSWWVDYSPWLNYGEDDNGSATGFDPETGKQTTGAILNTMERERVLAIIEGADGTVAEAGAARAVYVLNDNWVTPYGEMLQKQYRLINEYDFGTAYTPYAMVLSDTFGMMPVLNKPALAFFDQNQYDKAYLQFVNKIMWKGGAEKIAPDKDGVEKSLVNGKYGDTLDFIMREGLTDGLLDTYSAIILNYEEDDITEEDMAKYKKFVSNGGSLIFNTQYSKYIKDALGINLPSTVDKGEYVEIKYGKGSFIVFASTKNGMEVVYENEVIWDFDALGKVMDLLDERYNPFSFTAETGYAMSVSRDEKTIYLAVANNEGVIASASAPPVIDESKFIDIEITYKGIEKIKSVEDIYNSHAITLDGNNMSLHLDAADIALLKIDLE